MKSITLTIEITDEEFDVLSKINKDGYAEFRDSSFTWDEHYKKNKEIIDSNPEFLTKERFLNRNFGGKRKEVLSLYEKDLVEMSEDAWHLTFEITDLGRKFLNN